MISKGWVPCLEFDEVKTNQKKIIDKTADQVLVLPTSCMISFDVDGESAQDQQPNSRLL